LFKKWLDKLKISVFFLDSMCISMCILMWTSQVFADTVANKYISCIITMRPLGVLLCSVLSPQDEDITEDDSLIQVHYDLKHFDKSWVLPLQVCLKGGIAEETIKKLLARCQDQIIKDKLKANTQEAFDLGVSHYLGKYCSRLK